MHSINSGKHGKGYVKMSPSEHNKISNSVLLCEKITKCTQNKQGIHYHSEIKVEKYQG